MMVIISSYILAQSPSNGGFEDGTNFWTTAGTAVTTNARTGTNSLSHTTSSTSNVAHTNSSIIVVPNNNYAHVIGWALGSNSNARASCGGTLNATTNSTAILTIGTTLTQLTHSVLNSSGSAQNFTPRVNTRSVSGSTTLNWDDVIMYFSTSSTPDLTKPISATIFTNGIIASNSVDFSWTNGSDAGTGLQATIILRTTNTSAASPIMNDQAVYSLAGGTSGPNTVGSDWTILNVSVGSGTTVYTDNSVIPSTSYKYAVIHRDLAYNYSTALVSGTITTPSASCSAPSTQASAITFSSVGINTMTVGWTNGDGLARIVVMNTTNSFTDPTDGTTPLPDPNYGGSGEQVVYNGNGNSVDIAVLSPATTYWYRVYEYNCIALNTKYNITTAANNPNNQVTLASCAAPLTQASLINFTAVGGTVMTINWTPGNGSKRIVIINTTNSFTNPVDGVDPSANTAYSGSGEQVIYNNTGSSVSVTGLSYGTTYWYRVYEYNCSGVNTKYNTSTATDNPLSQMTTAAPALGFQLTTTNTNYVIDFDNTVANVNNGQYDGSGFTITPAVGQLNSDAWATTGMSDGASAFGGSNTTGDFARGISNGGVNTGGFYAFTVGTGNNAFGIQPGGSDWTPGTVTLRVQNNTGTVLSSLGLAYKVFNFNDGLYSGTFNFSYSFDNVTYTPVSQVDFASIEAADGSPAWNAYLRSLSLNSLSVANGNYIYLRWFGDDNGGSTSRDEFAIDDISIVANPTTVNQSFSGTLADAIITGTTQLSGPATVAGTVTLSNGNLILGANHLSAGSVNGGSATGYIQTNGTGALTVTNITTPAKELPVGNSTYNPLQLNNGSGFDWTARVEDAVNNVVAPFTTDKAINRTWHISPSATVVAGPDVTFNFDDADNAQLVNNVLYNGDPVRTVQVWHYGNGSWTAAGTSLAMTPGNGSQSLTLSGYTNFSPFAISKTSSPLPVTILSFAGQKERGVNVLRWSTANEFNNTGFEILRSTDGINYTAIGFVNSLAVNGNSNDVLNYIFTDIALSGTKQYYRLRQIDFDNRSNLSTIVLVKGERPVITVIDGVFPNPARSSVNILIAASEREKVTLVVTDMAGRVVSSKIVSVEQGSNTIPLDINQLNKGSFIVKLVCENGCNSAAKFMKL